MIVHAQRDMVRSWLGLSPHRIPLAGEPGSLAAMNAPDAVDFFSRVAPDDFVNEVCARVIIRADKYRPVESAGDVHCPVLLQICEEDALIPPEAVKKKPRRGSATTPKSYVILSGASRFTWAKTLKEA